MSVQSWAEEGIQVDVRRRRWRQWWWRIPLTALVLTLIGAAALLLHLTQPLTSLGRGLEGFTPEQKIGALALEGYLRRHPWSTDSFVFPAYQPQTLGSERRPWLVYWRSGLSFSAQPSPKDMIGSACAVGSQRYLAKLQEIARAHAYTIADPVCITDRAAEGPFAVQTWEEGVYHAGAGSGESFQAIVLGGFVVIFWAGSWMATYSER